MEEGAGMAPRRSAPVDPQIQPSADGAGVSLCLHPQIQASEEDAGVTRCCSPCLHPQIEASKEDAAMSRVSDVKSPAAPASLPDDDDMLREILLRLPPQPSSLPRASAVCNRWRRLVTDPKFHRQLRAHHGKPPLLGAFAYSDQQRRLEIVFTPFLDPPNRIAPVRFDLGRCNNGEHYLLDCRHGLVLHKDQVRNEIFVCDPITGEQLRAAIPADFKRCVLKGAVLCAADEHGHVHGGCHSRPFKVFLVSMRQKDNQPFAYVYFSESGLRGNLITTEVPCEIAGRPALLIGNCLYWLALNDGMLELHLDENSLTVIRVPHLTNIGYAYRQIILAENGIVGYSILSYPCFQMWKRDANGHGVATWVLWKTIEMDNTLGLPPQIEEGIACLVGYDEDTDSLFLHASGNVYVIHLKLMQSRKLYERNYVACFYPFKSFYTPGTSIAGGLNGLKCST